MSKPSSRNDEIVGRRFKSKQYNEYTVLSATDMKRSTNTLFEIEFDEINGVKYRYLARKVYILNGSVRNPFYPSVCGVGYMGNISKMGNSLEYKRWHQMISRCYNPKHKQYSVYGGSGVTVCKRWHSFENYFADFSKLDGYDKNRLEDLAVDKDIKIKGNKVYSPEACMFVTQSVNSKEMCSRVHKAPFIAISPEGERYESDFQKEFIESDVAEKYNMTAQGVSDVLKGRQYSHRGWKFIYKEDI